MASAKKYRLLWLLCIFGILLSCNDDDLKKVNTAQKVTLTKDRSYGVEVTYSDSAKVKAKGTAPILDKVTPTMGAVYSEMPKGVNITFYNNQLKSNGSLRSDYAISKEAERITIFRKNVVLVSDDMTFKTDELIWDENKKMYTSPYGTVLFKDGSTITGTEFTAPQDFSSYKIIQASGKTYFDGQLGP